jgi:heme/copper-type cytochrome/quinol oxidase subunit 2
VPAFLLIILVLPSISVLYIVEDVKSPVFSFKIVAHQWYWRYIVPLFKNFFYGLKHNNFLNYEFDSILDLENLYSPRLMGCSSDLFIPLNSTSRLLITSTDVIHSFSLPSIGLKVDAMPGRINQLFCTPVRLGVFFGQCSEICGSNHSFMPIRVKICRLEEYNKVRKLYFFDVLEDSLYRELNF